MDEPVSREKTLQSLLALFARSEFSWLTSVRPAGRPHSVPIWHVMQGEYIYLATATKSVKVVNVRSNPNVVVAARLEDPLAGLIVEGLARLKPDLRASVSKLFEAKYDWNIAEEDTYDALIEVEPVRLVAWGQYGEGRWTGEEIRKVVHKE